MLEIVGGTLVMVGGGMLTGAGLLLARAPRRSAELVAVLRFTPLPRTDRGLEQLLAHAGAALDGLS